MANRFPSPEWLMSGLASVGYLADERTVRTVWFADHLDRPILVEGPAGVGKTELAKSLAAVMPSRLIRLQCYEGLDEAKALYEWNYKKQLLRIQAEQSGGSWQEVEADVFTPKFLLTRPLLEAIRAEDPVVLLIDEVDRVEVETEALMLEVLSEFQVSIPELGTVTSTQRPLVLLTSNNTRQLSEALKRRCVYLSITYPTVEREKAILERRVPGISAHLADQAARHVAQLRALPLRKVPSISESIDWARTLVRLAVEVIDRDVMEDTMTLLLKYEGDLARAAEAQA